MKPLVLHVPFFDSSMCMAEHPESTIHLIDVQFDPADERLTVSGSLDANRARCQRHVPATLTALANLRGERSRGGGLAEAQLHPGETERVMSRITEKLQGLRHRGWRLR